MIDTHAHLYSEEFKDDYDAVINKAISAGIKAFVVPNVDSSSLKEVLSLQAKYPSVCYPTIGIHPTHIKDNYLSELAVMAETIKKHKFVAIGEIGIDLYWDKTHLKEQQIAFERQIEIALEYQLPIIVHTRQSFEETFTIIEKYKGKGLRGIFHCFSGNIEQGHRLIEMGFKLGIGGVLTFKNSGLGDTISHFSLHDFVLETDSPYLAPAPYRGQRNEPLYLFEVAKRLSEVFHTSIDQVNDITTTNAKQLFNI